MVSMQLTLTLIPQVNFKYCCWLHPASCWSHLLRHHRLTWTQHQHCRLLLNISRTHHHCRSSFSSSQHQLNQFRRPLINSDLKLRFWSRLCHQVSLISSSFSNTDINCNPLIAPLTSIEILRLDISPTWAISICHCWLSAFFNGPCRPKSWSSSLWTLFWLLEGGAPKENCSISCHWISSHWYKPTLSCYFSWVIIWLLTPNFLTVFRLSS